MAASVIVFFGVSAMQNAGVSTAEAKANPKNPYGACVRGQRWWGANAGRSGQSDGRHVRETREDCSARWLAGLQLLKSQGAGATAWRDGAGAKTSTRCISRAP
jgi:hypothetical protein